MGLLVFSALIGLIMTNSNPRKDQAAVSGAVLFISPDSGTYLVNNKFSVSVKLDTDKEINAVQATILFPTDKLEVISLLQEKSILSFWVAEPSYSNTEGMIQFIGGLPNPGFKGEGEIFTVVFRPKKEGRVQIKFKEGLVLANDGRGTNILREQRGAFYTFVSESPADLNDDGFIDIADLAILLSNWGVPKNPKADINKDGRVDIMDVSMFIFNFPNQ